MFAPKLSLLKSIFRCLLNHLQNKTAYQNSKNRKGDPSEFVPAVEVSCLHLIYNMPAFLHDQLVHNKDAVR